MKEKTEKNSFLAWLENFWWYYKWIVIILGCVAVFVLIALSQLLSKREGDVSFMYIGAGVLSGADCDKLKEFVAGNIADYNGDGSIEVSYLELTAHTDSVETMEGEQIVNYDVNNAVLQRFQNEIRAGDAQIYLVDKYYYDHYLAETKLLCPLSSVLTPSQMPKRTVDEYGVYLKDLGLKLQPGFSSLPDSTVVCLRCEPTEGTLNYGRTLESWTNNRQCFVKLVTSNADSVVFEDTNISILYYGDKKLSDEGLYYLKKWICANTSVDGRFGDIIYSFETVAPPIIIEGEESVGEEQLYKDLLTALNNSDGAIMLIDAKYMDVALKYGRFIKISERFTAEEVPAYTGDDDAEKKRTEYGIPIGWLDAQHMDGLSQLDKNTYICITDGKNASDGVSVVRKLLSYKYNGAK